MKARRSTCLLVTAVFLVGPFSAGLTWGGKGGNKPPKNPPPPDISYSITRMGTLGGGYSMARGMNNLGEVVGASETGGGDVHAFVFTGGNLVDLNTLLEANTPWVLRIANDINNSGQIVGTGCIDDDGDGQLDRCTAAFRYTPPTETAGYLIEELVGLGGDGDNPRPMAINNQGDVAGHSDATDEVWHAVIWPGEQGTNGVVNPNDLGVLEAGAGTFASAINDRVGEFGDVQVAGYSKTVAGNRGWRYDSATGQMQELGVLKASKNGGSYSEALDINFDGVTVGSSTAGRFSDHAVLYSPTGGQLTDLGTLSGDDSYATGINDGSDVVGEAQINTSGAVNPFVGFISFGGGALHELEPLITNLPNDMVGRVIPWKINNAGQICGPFSDNFNFDGEAFLLTPN